MRSPDLLLDLTRRYCEPHRHYHTIRHVAEMLWNGRELALDDVQIAAIWYHDAVYEIPGPDNEENSARLAERQLAAAGWEPADVARVAGIVRDTKQHVPTVAGAAEVLDLDLLGLGSEPAVFAANNRAIRAEYAIYDDEAFRAGQRQALQRFLDRERIYHTPLGTRFETRARANLRAALAD